jgi:hypothetical protein
VGKDPVDGLREGEQEVSRFTLGSDRRLTDRSRFRLLPSTRTDHRAHSRLIAAKSNRTLETRMDLPIGTKQKKAEGASYAILLVPGVWPQILL